MLKSAFSLGEKLKVRNLTYFIYNKHWEKFDLSALNLEMSRWKTIKYLNTSGTDFHKDIKLVPKDKGGLYLFTVRTPILPGITDFPVYVGRAQLTEGQNLNKRCKEYFLKHRNDKERPLITTMFQYWSKELYLSFMEIKDNKNIIDYEKKLINSLILPLNDEIPDIQIRQAKKAFKL